MRDLSDTEIGRLQLLLDALVAAPARLAPLDVSAIDGYLCGVVLQPHTVAERDWLPPVLGCEGDPPAPGAVPAVDALLPLLRQRHALLGEAIAARRWFDPWIFETGSGAAPASQASEGLRASVLPWVTGFWLATERFPALTRMDGEVLAEPLALLYLHFEPEELDDLEGEPALAAAIEATEPPADLAQAAEDLVRAVLLLADVSAPGRGRTTPAHASPGPAPRWRSGSPARARRG